MPEERADVETKSSDSPEVYQQTKFMAWFEKAFPWLLVGGATPRLFETYHKNMQIYITAPKCAQTVQHFLRL